jgi:hypothetical protein
MSSRLIDWPERRCSRMNCELESYPAPATAVRQAFGDILEKYRRALVFMAECGIQIKPGSRLHSYQESLAHFTDQDPPLAPTRDLERFAFALREIDEVVEIVGGLSRPPQPREIAALTAIAAGRWHPDDETDGNSVRDLQYELWLLSEFRRRSVDAELAEPDLRIRWRGQWYPVAAKRPRNRRGLDRCVRDAIRQLEPFPAGGVLGISVDLLLRPRGQTLDAASPLEAAELIDLLFVDLLRWLASRQSPLSKRAPGTNAMVFLITGAIPAFIRDVGTFCLERRSEVLSVKGDQRASGLAGFDGAFGSYVRPS